MIFIFFTMLAPSCFLYDRPNEKYNTIFHAGPSDGGIASLYFVLYSNNKYKICASGGIGETCETGSFILNNDTITFQNFNSKIPIKYPRLIIFRYNNQDSSYWKWKCSENKVATWQDFKWMDSAFGGTGDVYQINKDGIVAKEEDHFVIRYDKLISK